jgi:hypothetical protein
VVPLIENGGLGQAMVASVTESKSAAAGAPRPNLRLSRPDNPYVALGLAVNHLMTKPAFASLRFGDWSRVLVGQINRKHYAFVSTARIRFRDSWAGR